MSFKQKLTYILKIFMRIQPLLFYLIIKKKGRNSITLIEYNGAHICYKVQKIRRNNNNEVLSPISKYSPTRPMIDINTEKNRDKY